MKNQYFGDLNDYKKYALLRVLGNGGKFSTTVCWALTPDDDKTDGSRIGYLSKPETWKALDPVVFEHLRQTVGENGDRRVASIEESGVLPNCRYFDDELPADNGGREEFFDRLYRFADGTDLVFFDPDNGLGVPSAPRGGRNSSKYVYRDEVCRTFLRGHSVLIYQHFPRRARGPYLSAWAAQFDDLAGLKRVVSFSTSHVAFVLLPQARHERTLLRSAATVADRWRGVVNLQLHYPAPPADMRPKNSAPRIERSFLVDAAN
jgi:hypothetical protein